MQLQACYRTLVQPSELQNCTLDQLTECQYLQLLLLLMLVHACRSPKRASSCSAMAAAGVAAGRTTPASAACASSSDTHAVPLPTRVHPALYGRPTAKATCSTVAAGTGRTSRAWARYQNINWGFITVQLGRRVQLHLEAEVPVSGQGH